MLNKEAIRLEMLQNSIMGHYVSVCDAFDSDFAVELYKELSINDLWEHQDHTTNEDSARRQSTDFTYSRKQIHSDSKIAPEKLKKFFNYLNSDECLNFISEISGRNCTSFWGGAAVFDKGDHISKHNDFYVYKDKYGDVYTRAVTLTYYLTKKWDQQWGGELVWEKPKAEIIPEFNKLVLFNVGTNTYHWVAPVKPTAKEKRYSITGWFLTKRTQAELKSLRPNFKYI